MGNPLTAGLAQSLIPQPCTLVIFGGAGDLSARKLLPALYNLSLDGVLPANFAVVGFARNELDDSSFAAFARDGIQRFSRRPVADAHWAEYARSMFYAPGSFADPQAYAELKRRLEKIETEFGIPGNRVFYLSIPPSLIATSVDHLSAAGLVADPRAGPISRIIVEKPVGRDLASARAITKSWRVRSTNRRSSGSITTSERRPCRTCWSCASPIRCSSRSGTRSTSITFSSRWPRRRALAPAPGTTRKPGPSGTWCRTTSSRCWP